MKSWKPPTPEQVARATEMLGHPQQQRYFFDRLDNPLWVKPLDELGWFAQPPAAVTDADRETIQFPAWPQSRYLVRMAALPDARAEVLRIVAALDTDNVLVHEDVADVALAVPAADSAQLAGC